MIEQFLSGLKGVHRSGDGWNALCPAHADRIPSLSVGLGQDGRILLNCHRGCSTEAVLGALHLTAGDLFPKAAAALPGPNRTNYDYLDEEGKLAYRVVREAGKRFRQCRPDGNGGWIWNLRGVQRLLYRLPELREAVSRGEIIYIVEGEKDVERLRGSGLAATCNSGGAGKWPRECSAHLTGARVVIVGDNDDAGRLHAWFVAEAVAPIAAEVRVLELPGLPEKGDVSDWLDNGGSLETLRQLAAAAALYTPLPPASLSPPEPSNPSAGRGQSAPDGPRDVSSSRPPAAASVLIQIGREADLFHSDRGEPFARLPTRGRREIYLLDSRAFRNWLSLRYFELHRKPPTADALAGAIAVLTGIAGYQSPEHALHVRIAPEADDSLWYDLVDKEWRAVRITAEDWEIVDEPPILFRRYSHLAAQVEPMRDGSLDELRGFLNLTNDADWYLLVAWLAAALIPGIAHPVLVIHGEQGSSKSTTARMLGSLVDPSLVALRAEPRDLTEWIQAADHSWLISLDNVSRIPSWLSDALCRAVTGEAFLKRTLYTNDEDSLSRFQRVVVLTGIETVVQRPDLLDRSILLGLDPIRHAQRKSERLMLQAFEEARPRIFGALLTLVSGVLRELPSVPIETLPRLADFARVGMAAERAAGWPQGTFAAAHKRNSGAQNEEAIDSSPVGEALIWFSEDLPNSVNGMRFWEGSATQLLDELTDLMRKCRPLDWPRDPKQLTGQIRRLAPSLRSLGIEFQYDRRNDMRLIRVYKIPKTPPAPQQPVATDPES